MAHDRYTIDDLLKLTKANWQAADTPVHALIMTLVRVMDAASHNHAALAATHGLSPAEFDVLATLRKVAPPHRLTPTELQQAVVITSGGLTKVLHQLEARGLVARSVAAEDRRRKQVRLTRAGKALIERAMTAVLAGQGEWIDRLGRRDQEQLLQLLRQALGAMASRGDHAVAVKKARH